MYLASAVLYIIVITWKYINSPDIEFLLIVKFKCMNYTESIYSYNAAHTSDVIQFSVELLAIHAIDSGFSCKHATPTAACNKTRRQCIVTNRKQNSP